MKISNIMQIGFMAILFMLEVFSGVAALKTSDSNYLAGGGFLLVVFFVIYSIVKSCDVLD